MFSFSTWTIVESRGLTCLVASRAAEGCLRYGIILEDPIYISLFLRAGPLERQHLSTLRYFHGLFYYRASGSPTPTILNTDLCADSHL